MKCPFCGEQLNRVVDSKSIEEGLAIFRRRECLSCEGIFTTCESREVPIPRDMIQGRACLENLKGMSSTD